MGGVEEGVFGCCRDGDGGRRQEFLSTKENGVQKDNRGDCEMLKKLNEYFGWMADRTRIICFSRSIFFLIQYRLATEALGVSWGRGGEGVSEDGETRGL